MRIIVHWITLSVAVFLASRFISGITIDPIWTALIVGACLTLFNMIIRPIVKILTLPINILTLGLFSLIINGAIFWYLGTLIKGFSVATFTAAFIGALIVSILSWLISKVFRVE
jgi:putative membrane protein